MSKEIFLNPDAFEAEVSNFKTAVEAVSAVESKDIIAEQKKTILDSMDELISIINLFTETVEGYSEFSIADAGEMTSMKEKWVTQDRQLAQDIGGN